MKKTEETRLQGKELDNCDYLDLFGTPEIFPQGWPPLKREGRVCQYECSANVIWHLSRQRFVENEGIRKEERQITNKLKIPTLIIGWANVECIYYIILSSRID